MEIQYKALKIWLEYQGRLCIVNRTGGLELSEIKTTHLHLHSCIYSLLSVYILLSFNWIFILIY